MGVFLNEIGQGVYIERHLNDGQIQTTMPDNLTIAITEFMIVMNMCIKGTYEYGECVKLKLYDRSGDLLVYWDRDSNSVMWGTKVYRGSENGQCSGTEKPSGKAKLTLLKN